MTIKVFVTGGTIDDLDYDSKEKEPNFHKSLVPDLLKQARITAECNVEILMQKDGKLVTEEDRKFILKKCQECKEDEIIITHGTVTMQDTAQYLGKKKLAKTIVLVGSAIPGNKENTDALFNLGFAFSAVQLKPNGVYIAMNGNVFTWDNVRKNKETGKFETIK